MDREDSVVASRDQDARPQTEANASATPSIAYVAELETDVHNLTVALTGLTCGGSEFFNRRGGRYVADIPACIAYVRGRQSDQHNTICRAVMARKAADAKLAASADVAEAARDLVMKPGGLVNRGVGVGLVVVEKADKSDPHYRLCTALERLDALTPEDGSQTGGEPRGDAQRREGE